MPQTMPCGPLPCPVLVGAPAHSDLIGPLSYQSELPLAPGTLVHVPLGRREVLGIVWDNGSSASLPPPAAVLRPVSSVLADLPPLPLQWRQLVTFAAAYYQRAPGELALAALPPNLKNLSPAQLARRLAKPRTSAPSKRGSKVAPAPAALPLPTAPRQLSPQQDGALAQIATRPGPFLLFGATGSGKTEVYLQAVALALSESPNSQALVLVPEINLTPQLLASFRARFEPLYGPQAVTSLHSQLTPAQRLAHWLAAHSGAARIVLGTRMAVLASLPDLRLIVVDEEHDPSYKQQDGARYSARDLAVWRGKNAGAKVILGSATPSLESWHQSRPAGADGPQDSGGRYLRLLMPQRIGRDAPNEAHYPSHEIDSATRRLDGGKRPIDAKNSAKCNTPLVQTGLAQLRLVDMRQHPRGTVLSAPLLAALATRLACGEQSLLLLNRRGYAPVLACHACGWKSQCPHCTAHRVFHKLGRMLRCHHCGLAERVPRACPDCGNPDIAPLGRGTERLEEHVAQWLATQHKPDGSAPQLARIDADSTRKSGALATRLASVHAGEVDVLVGTQMIAKGHDFRRVTLVGCLEADSALFSSDFRAPERLFSLLMQAGGRAGRDANQISPPELWVQTFAPGHPLFGHLARHDYPGFAQQQLAERRAAGLPPLSYQALLRADARTQELAQGFLQAAREQALDGLDGRITLYPAVPLGMARVADVERAQMLVESPSRGALQAFLQGWQPLLHALRQQPAGKGIIRWAVDVDPVLI